jgi:hypothetical protein
VDAGSEGNVEVDMGDGKTPAFHAGTSTPLGTRFVGDQSYETPEDGWSVMNAGFASGMNISSIRQL